MASKLETLVQQALDEHFKELFGCYSEKCCCYGPEVVKCKLGSSNSEIAAAVAKYLNTK